MVEVNNRFFYGAVESAPQKAVASDPNALRYWKKELIRNASGQYREFKKFNGAVKIAVNVSTEIWPFGSTSIYSNDSVKVTSIRETGKYVVASVDLGLMGKHDLWVDASDALLFLEKSCLRGSFTQSRQELVKMKGIEKQATVTLTGTRIS